ncbi:MAG: hypothetical protein AAF721_40090 [Myxococcota bacterium]
MLLRSLGCTAAVITLALTASAHAGGPKPAGSKAAGATPTAPASPAAKAKATQPAAPAGTITLWPGQLYVDGAFVNTELSAVRLGGASPSIQLREYGVFEINYPLTSARGKDIRLACTGGFKPTLSLKTLAIDRDGTGWDEDFGGTRTMRTGGTTFTTVIPAHRTTAEMLVLEMRSYIPLNKGWSISECTLEQIVPARARTRVRKRARTR